MTAAEVAVAFADMLKAGDHLGAAARFNAPHITSHESFPGPMALCEGAAAVQQKSDWWYANHEIHSADSEGPFVHGDQFIMIFAVDVTFRPTGQRMQMRETGLYTVAGGQIVSERFFNQPM